jgi:hypothetical protein
VLKQNKRMVPAQPQTPEFWIAYRQKMATIRQKQEDLVKTIRKQEKKK